MDHFWGGGKGKGVCISLVWNLTTFRWEWLILSIYFHFLTLSAGGVPRDFFNEKNVPWLKKVEKHCHNTYRAIAAVIADSTFVKGDDMPQESYISHKRVSHFVIFSYIVSIHTYLFLIFISLQYSHTIVLQKSAYQNVQYWSFYGTLKITKIRSRMFFFLSFPSHFSFPDF